MRADFGAKRLVYDTLEFSGWRRVEGAVILLDSV